MTAIERLAHGIVPCAAAPSPAAARAVRNSRLRWSNASTYGAGLREASAVTVTTSGNRQPSIWASVVSDDAAALREWLLALGFVEDLAIPGERGGALHHCQLDWPEGGRI